MAKRLTNKKAWEYYENIISNLSGWVQVYRFIDRLESTKNAGMTFVQNMEAFLLKYPQYNQKKGKK